MTSPTNVETETAADLAATGALPKPLSFVDIRLDPTKLTQSNTPETAANPTTTKPGKFDPSRLRLNQGFEAGATTRTSPIAARKPDPHNWFMAHPAPARLARYMDRAARWLQHTAPATTPGRSRRSGLRWRRPGGRGHAARRRRHRGRQLQRTATTPPRQRRARTAN